MRRAHTSTTTLLQRALPAVPDLRVWSFEEAECIDAAFLERRIGAAVALRQRLPIASTGVWLIHGEAHGRPALIVDRYADTRSVQLLAAGVERWRDTLVELLCKATGLMRVFERSDSGVRGLEGLEARAGWQRGEGATEVVISEHDWSLALNVAEGHKTGFYLDQRDNRRHYAYWVRQLGCRRVLNCYCYTGGFSVAALAGGSRRRSAIAVAMRRSKNAASMRSASSKLQARTRIIELGL